MKLCIPFLICLLAAGCASTKSVAPSSIQTTMSMQAQPKVVAPVYPTLTLQWNPGDYTRFIIVSSTNLALPLRQWATLLSTTNTSCQVAMSNSCRFFALYGTNIATQDYAWCTP